MASYTVMNHQSDQCVIDKVLKGDTNAYAVLVKRYENLVFTVALRVVKQREEAEELAQDTFVSAYKALPKFRGDSKFSTWLYKIVYRKALDRVKQVKRKSVSVQIEKLSEDDINGIQDALTLLEIKERKRIIGESIMKLPEDTASLITLYYYEDLSVKEISKITKLSADNIKIKLFRGRKMLFNILKHHVTQFKN